MAKITKVLVERAKAPAAGQKFIRDDELTGFALRVTAAGVKAFVWEGRIRGRVRRVTLGQYPALTVLAARKRALETKTAIVNGEDPAAERKNSRREVTFGELVQAYLEQHSKPHKQSWKRDAARLEAHFGRWNARCLSDLSRAELVKLQHTIREEHGPIASNRAMMLLRSVFNWATGEQKFSGDNPALGLTFFKEGKRQRFLNAGELSRVNEALLQEPDWRWRSYFPLLLLLGLRRSELLAARWQDVDLEARTITIPRTKSGESRCCCRCLKSALDLLANYRVERPRTGLNRRSGCSRATVRPAIWPRSRARGGASGNAPALPISTSTTCAILWRAGWSRRALTCRWSDGHLITPAPHDRTLRASGSRSGPAALEVNAVAMRLGGEKSAKADYRRDHAGTVSATVGGAQLLHSARLTPETRAALEQQAKQRIPARPRPGVAGFPEKISQPRPGWPSN